MALFFQELLKKNEKIVASLLKFSLATYVTQCQPWDSAFSFQDAKVLKRDKNGTHGTHSQHDPFFRSSKSKIFTIPSGRDFEHVLITLENTILFISKLYLCEICGMTTCLSSVL